MDRQESVTATKCRKSFWNKEKICEFKLKLISLLVKLWHQHNKYNITNIPLIMKLKIYEKSKII